MSQVIASHCYYCGSLVDPQRDDFCPNCHYPASPAKEEAYLTATIDSLQQAMSFGGAQLKVVELYQRYQKRLGILRKRSANPVSHTSAAENAPEVATPASVRVTSVVYQMQTPGLVAEAPPIPVDPQGQRRLFSWRSFLTDNAINIVASLGAFLVLVGALSFVAATSSLLLAFLIVFAVHAVFGITGIVTHRFASFRIVSNVYTVIFSLLIPLVGFSAYRLVGGSQLALSVPMLIAISAAYAAIVYIMLAIFQRYSLFAHFGMAALAVADLALASALNLALWWWPSTLMILALLSLVSIARSSAISRLFEGNRDILRRPVRMFMFVFIVMGTIGMALVALYSVNLDRVTIHSTEAGYAILCLSILRLFWSMGHFYLARRTRGLITLAILFLICVLSFCYALQFDATGYALALTAVALLYAAFSRFAVQLLHPFGTLEVQLDRVALALALLVPFIAIPTFPLKVALMFTSTATLQASWQTFAGVAVTLTGLVLTLSIAFKRAGYEAFPRQSPWRWLLLLAAFLGTCACSLIILALHLSPLWSFLGVSVALTVGAVFVRQNVDGAWADPIDISALYTILITLGLGINAGPEILRRLLFFYFAATYAILLYQRRAKWLFVPTVFAVCALLLPGNSFQLLLVLPPVLAILAVAARRFAGKASSAPLALLALLAGITTGFTGFPLHPGATAVALLVYALLSYIAGIVEDTSLPMWITPFFATWSVIISVWFLDDFLRAPIVTLVAASLGMAVSLYRRGHASAERPRRRLSALPLYTTALLAALFTALWSQVFPAWPAIVPFIMLGFTALALAIVLVERIPELLIFPVGFAAGAIWFWYPQLDFTSLMIAYTGLCALVFAIQFTWRVLPHRTLWLAPTTLHETLGIGGQALVVIAILFEGGFFAGAGILAHVGAGALLALAALIFAYGLLRPRTVGLWLPTHIDVSSRLKRTQLAREAQRRCYYISGLLLSLVVSWELSAFHQTRLDVLLLAPASYLIVIAPYLMRDAVLEERRTIGHIAAILGVCLLLLPTLWFSFNDDNFVATALLLGESLALLLLGGLARVRIFILSSAGLVIVGTLRALFLATPPSLTLMITGVLLLLIATALMLVRHRLQVAWKHWE